MFLVILEKMVLNEASKGIVAITVGMFFRTKGETLGLRKNFGKIGLTTNKRIRS